jgi:hypothetical protein
MARKITFRCRVWEAGKGVVPPEVYRIGER